jgi:hypothetical protein
MAAPRPIALIADTGAAVDGEDHEKLARRPRQAQSGESQRQENHNRAAKPEGKDALPAREIDERAIEVIDQDRQGREAEQPPRTRELELKIEGDRQAGHQSIHLR